MDTKDQKRRHLEEIGGWISLALWGDKEVIHSGSDRLKSDWRPVAATIGSALGDSCRVQSCCHRAQEGLLGDGLLQSREVREIAATKGKDAAKNRMEELLSGAATVGFYLPTFLTAVAVLEVGMLLPDFIPQLRFQWLR